MSLLGRNMGRAAECAAEVRRLGLRKAVARFRREEDGSLIIFGLYCFLMMLLVAGVAIDVMRFEYERTRLQATLDRAVLAAADMHQALDSEAVVRDYFAKAGLSHLLVDVDVKSGVNYRTVSATTKTELPTWFMKSVGVPVLNAPASGIAEERMGDVEISMVLDVSGSMKDSVTIDKKGTKKTKIELLRQHGGEFIDEMFTKVQGEGSLPGKLSISIVPYNQQVNLGPDLGARFNLSNEHNASHCVDFYSDDFTTVTLSPTTRLPRTALADLRYSYQAPYFIECHTRADARVLAFSNDQTTLKSKVNSLTADGDTAIDIGTKWGLAFLDPSTRPVLDAIIADSASNAKVRDIAGRPFDYGNREALKVLVLMTDGENTNSYALKPPYREGPSSFYKGVTKDSRNRDVINYYYYRPEQSGDKDYWRLSDSKWYRPSEVGTLTQYNYQELWQMYSVQWFNTNVWSKADSSKHSLSKARDHVSYGGKDDRLLSLCQEAKRQDVVIFTIGFDAPTAGQTMMKQCATDDSYYYPANGQNIASVFASIANAITQLRLIH